MSSHFSNMIFSHSSNISPETFPQCFKSDLFSKVQKSHYKKILKHSYADKNVKFALLPEKPPLKVEKYKLEQIQIPNNARKE